MLIGVITDENALFNIVFLSLGLFINYKRIFSIFFKYEACLQEIQKPRRETDFWKKSNNQERNRFLQEIQQPRKK